MKGLHMVTALRQYRFLLLIFVVLNFMVFLITSAGQAEEPDCAACHEALTKGKSVHQAISMGCTACHTAVNAATVPHKMTNKNPRGLSSKLRDLCFGCHDKQSFMKKTIHSAMTLGCTSCHDPHVSANEHLLKEAVPKLCLSCHEGRLTTKKNDNHAPGMSEECSGCHNPHATDTPKLLVPGLS